MKIYYKVNGQWLGSTLNAPGMINAEVKISTESVDGIGTISLVAEDNITVATIDVGARQSYTWKVSVLPEFDYYYHLRRYVHRDRSGLGRGKKQA